MAIINKHNNAQSRANAQNAAVDTLSYSISFPSVVEDEMKIISKLPYRYFTNEKQHYNLLEDVCKLKNIRNRHISMSN